MVEHTVVSHLLVLGAWTAIVGIRIDADAASGRKQSCYLNVLWVHQLDKILHDGVDAVLVEITVVTEAEEVELQALTLHHTLARDVVDTYLGKVGLTCNGTQAGEFGTVEAHPVVVVGVTVLEGLQDLRRVVECVVGLLAELLQFVLFAVHEILILLMWGL